MGARNTDAILSACNSGGGGDGKNDGRPDLFGHPANLELAASTDPHSSSKVSFNETGKKTPTSTAGCRYNRSTSVRLANSCSGATQGVSDLMSFQRRSHTKGLTQELQHNETVQNKVLRSKSVVTEKSDSAACPHSTNSTVHEGPDSST